MVSDWYRRTMAMTLRLSEDLDAKLAAVAATRHMSKQQAIVYAVEKFVAENSHADRVSALAVQAAVDYAETLRRLGE